MMNEIKVIESFQIATIEDNIIPIVEQVKKEIAELKIDLMEVSEDNKQTLKDARANLNKKLADYETERKKIKEFVLKPYSDFESIYNDKLKSVINDAVKELDNKIKSIEAGQLKELEDYAKEYFQRKLESNPITIGNTFKHVDIKVNLSTNKKKIREAIDFHFEKMESSMIIINANDNSARLRSIFETEAGYDIGIALTKLTKQLVAEKKYAEETDISSMYPTQTREPMTKVQPQVEIKSQEIIGEVFDFNLKITVTENQLALLTVFMDNEDIIYELYEE